jgi:hypothetical protein
MTSKADRRRRKIAARKMASGLIESRAEEQASIAPDISRFSRSTPMPQPPPPLVTERQEAAMRWFADLRRAQDAGGVAGDLARPQLEAIRAEISADEFSILSEVSRAAGWVNRRVGRSRQTTFEIELSALRKLVVYRATNGLDGEDNLKVSQP